MRHAVDGRKFGRNSPHRKAMFRNMANAVIMDEQITTTLAKAKEVRRVVDRLITLGKTNTVHSQRLAFSRTRNKEVVAKLFSALSDRYKTRNGGYTRVLKISDRRRGDAAETAILELVDHPVLNRKKVKPAEEGEGAQEKAAGAPEASGGDPFGRFRKLFSGSRKKQKAVADKAKTEASGKK